MNIVHRVARLEAQRECHEPALTPADEHTRATMERLLIKMDQAHATEVRADLVAMARGGSARAGSLTIAFLGYVVAHEREGAPLELPAEVAEVYRSDGAAQPLAQCGECGYALPFRWAVPDAPELSAKMQYFEACPVCEGATGWQAYLIRHGHSGPRWTEQTAAA